MGEAYNLSNLLSTAVFYWSNITLSVYVFLKLISWDKSNYNSDEYRQISIHMINQDRANNFSFNFRDHQQLAFMQVTFLHNFLTDLISSPQSSVQASVSISLHPTALPFLHTTATLKLVIGFKNNPYSGTSSLSKPDNGGQWWLHMRCGIQIVALQQWVWSLSSFLHNIRHSHFVFCLKLLVPQ
jgi:hypothetical protein